MTDVRLAISAAFDRSLCREGGASVRHLVARLHADRTGATPAPRGPLNIALVVDASGSMANGKLEAAKEAALGLAGRLTERDRLTLVSFASRVQVHLDAVPAGAASASRIRGEISRLRPRDMTNLSGGWFAGVDCAARIAEADALMTPRVILLSDGHANEGIADPAELRRHAGELRRRGVLTSALGIGDGYDEQLLRGMAESGGGRLHDAEHADEIASVLLGELDDISGTLVEDAEILITLPPGARAEVLGKPEVVARDNRLVVELGALRAGVERFAVVRVTCPRARRGDTLGFALAATGRAVDDGSRIETGVAEARLTAADSTANQDQPRDREAAGIVARMWSAEVVATAARMNRDRDFAGAQAYVAARLRHFRRYVTGLPNAQKLLADLETLARHADRKLSSRMHKEMVVMAELSMGSRLDHRGEAKEAWAERMARGD